MEIKKTLLSIRPAIIFIACQFLICALFIAVFPSYASASATLSLIPASGSYTIGNNFSVSVDVDTGGDSINAIQADLTFNNTKLAVSSVDTSSSILKIWVQYPSFSNSAGTINFSGGVPAVGFSGTGTIFTINFKGIAVGSGDVSFGTDGQVLLNDGSGTNIIGTNSNGTYDITPAPPSISCSALPSSAGLNVPVTFTAHASGGNGSYTYSWSNACTGSSSTCTNSAGFDSPGSKTATVTVTSGGLSSSAACSVAIALPGLNVSCSSTTDSIGTGSPVTFTAHASGGNGSYAYSWSNACTGSSSTCTNSYNTGGMKKATVTVTSGNLTSSADCLLAVCACVAQSGASSGTQCTVQTGGTGNAVPPASSAPASPNLFVCAPFITKYIKIGAVNDAIQVKRLQIFLKYYQGFSDVNETGIYDHATYTAIKAFQSKYAKDVLVPWNLTSATGFVYMTTAKKINELFCQGIPFAPGISSAAQKNIIEYVSKLLKDLGASMPQIPKPSVPATTQLPTTKLPPAKAPNALSNFIKYLMQIFQIVLNGLKNLFSIFFPGK
jgi:hypothetical protein